MSNPVHIAGFILSIVMLSGCGENINTGDKISDNSLIDGIVIEQVIPREVTEFYEASGTVRSVNTSHISAKVVGEVKDIRANVSDSVKKGNVLLVIDSPDIEAREKAAAEAVGEADRTAKMAGQNKDLMDKTFERFKKLYDGKAVSEQEFDEIKTKREVTVLEYELSRKALKKAEAALEEAEAFRNYTIIRSPVNGTIAERKIDIGSMTAPGMPLMLIEEPGYRVEAAVDESMIPSINIADPVEIIIDALGVKTEGSVGEIVRSIDPATRTFIVKIDLKDNSPLLRGGLYSRARFPVRKNTRLFIDETSVTTRGELRGVYAVDEHGTITLRIIKTGVKQDGMIEVLSGLETGEQIVIDGVEKAVDGGRIK